MRGRRNCTASIQFVCGHEWHWKESLQCQDPAGHPDEHYYSDQGLTIRWDDSHHQSTPDRDDQPKDTT